MYCAGYTKSNTDPLTLSTASSVPTRFTYTKPNFTVTAVDEAKDGNLYEPSLRKLFPKIFYTRVLAPSNDAITLLSQETLAKAQAQLDNDAQF